MLRSGRFSSDNSFAKIAEFSIERVTEKRGEQQGVVMMRVDVIMLYGTGVEILMEVFPPLEYRRQRA